MEKKQVTIKDIARKLNLHHTTVSRALRDHPNVKPATKELVFSLAEELGRILDYLDTAGLRENTIVIYTSDQGMFLGEHDYVDKRWIFEESLRMPFLVRYELRNVYGEAAYTEVAKELKARLLQIKEELGDTDEKYPELMRIREKYWNWVGIP